jgi:uncharacterized protein YkwD
VPFTSPRRGLPRHALAAVLILAATPVASAHATADTLVPCAGSAVEARGAEARLTALVNATRQRAGQPPLARSAWLQRVARRRTGQIRARGQLQHDFQGGRLSWAPPTSWAGENLAISTTPKAAMAAMLASPTHRTVLLFGRWKTLGVGARASCDGQVIYALDFLG